MASFNQKFKLRSALSAESNKFSFVEDHTTSSDFLELLPLYKRLLIPRSKFKMSAEVFCRLNAMNSVNYGRANFNLRAFFVPLRTCWFGWNEFISDTFQKGSSALVSSVPYIPNSVLTSFFRASNYSTRVAIVDDITDTTTPFDFSYPNGGTQGQPKVYWLYKFTPLGKRYYKILRSLGYDIFMPNWYSRDGSSSGREMQVVEYNFNALPLLALARVAYDWYYPSQYASSLADVTRLFYITGTHQLTQASLGLLLDLINVSYSPDYFTSAFDRPNSPNNRAGESPITFETGDGYTDDGQRVNADNELVTNIDTNLIGNQFVDPHINTALNSITGRSKISQFTLDTLMALSNYLKRNQLAGSRVIDRYLARYGVKLSSAQLERCIYLSGETNPLQFGTVFSQADSGDATVGDYNGTGLFSQNAPSFFSCDSGEDYGYFFILGSFIPEIGYVQGVDRDILYTSRFDMFTPEFDALGTQAISASELYSSPANDKFKDWQAIIQSVFAFTPRYSEYKVARDRVTGDFCLNSNSKSELRSYTLKRLFDQSQFTFGGQADVANIKHSLSFVLSSDSSQYNRIFYTDTGTEDHLRLVAFFRSELFAPMKQLYDVYDWDKHNEDGNELVIDTNGAKLD